MIKKITMVWKGVLIEESLEDKSLLNLTKIVETDIDRLKEDGKVRTLHKIEVEDNKKDEFIQTAIKKLKLKFYTYLVKDKVMYVLFRDHMFKFSRGYPELEAAKEYGKRAGIPEEQMPFEYLIEHPLDTHKIKLMNKDLKKNPKEVLTEILEEND
jgi:hypothetical protein